MDMIIKDIIIL